MSGCHLVCAQIYDAKSKFIEGPRVPLSSKVPGWENVPRVRASSGNLPASKRMRMSDDIGGSGDENGAPPPPETKEEYLVPVAVSHTRYTVQMNLRNQGLDEHDANFYIDCLAFPADTCKQMTGFDYDDPEFRRMFSKFHGKNVKFEHWGPAIGQITDVKFRRDGMHLRFCCEAPNYSENKELLIYIRNGVKHAMLAEVSVSYWRHYREESADSGFEVFYLSPDECSVCYKGRLKTAITGVVLSEAAEMYTTTTGKRGEEGEEGEKKTYPSLRLTQPFLLLLGLTPPPFFFFLFPFPHSEEEMSEAQGGQQQPPPVSGQEKVTLSDDALKIASQVYGQQQSQPPPAAQQQQQPPPPPAQEKVVLSEEASKLVDQVYGQQQSQMSQQQHPEIKGVHYDKTGTPIRLEDDYQRISILSSSLKLSQEAFKQKFDTIESRLALSEFIDSNVNPAYQRADALKAENEEIAKKCNELLTKLQQSKELDMALVNGGIKVLNELNISSKGVESIPTLLKAVTDRLKLSETNVDSLTKTVNELKSLQSWKIASENSGAARQQQQSSVPPSSQQQQQLSSLGGSGGKPPFVDHISMSGSKRPRSDDEQQQQQAAPKQLSTSLVKAAKEAGLKPAEREIFSGVRGLKTDPLKFFSDNVGRMRKDGSGAMGLKADVLSDARVTQRFGDTVDLYGDFVDSKKVGQNMPWTLGKAIPQTETPIDFGAE
jgi:hypothetical protein